MTAGSATDQPTATRQRTAIGTTPSPAPITPIPAPITVTRAASNAAGRAARSRRLPNHGAVTTWGADVQAVSTPRRSGVTSRSVPTSTNVIAAPSTTVRARVAATA